MKTKLTLLETGQFKINNVDNLSYLYFPLTNIHSLKSSISPFMGGECTIDQNHFVLPPISIEDLHASNYKRNVYFRIDDTFTWSTSGNTPYQILNKDEVNLEADFLIHKLIRKNQSFTCEVESFVPYIDEYIELHKVTFKNSGENPLKVKPVIGFPLYCRSANNIRDHRHVSALFNKVEILDNGIINKPEMLFDEKGHEDNDMNYGFFVNSNSKIKNFWPVMEEFIGEGHSLLDPLVVSENIDNEYKVGSIIEGFEIIGGFEYEEKILKTNETLEFYIVLVVGDSRNIVKKYSNLNSIIYDELKSKTKDSWEKELSTINFNFSDKEYNGWLKWVTLQPILRRIYGNSFLPYHDYGKGGRGWRDLWQDALSLILMNPRNVRSMLFENFAGVRIDGSNATIIGNSSQKFIADRNNISRVWMDHGAWPFITVKLYLDYTADVDFLFEKQTYFKDKFIHYTKKKLSEINIDNLLRDANGNIYKGTILEHLLLENLIPFYNVGSHNICRLEDADWNDGLDMAKTNGESVAFTALYANNLLEISKLLTNLKSNYHIDKVTLISEIKILLDDMDLNDIKKKRLVLEDFFSKVENQVSDKPVVFDINWLIEKIKERAGFLSKIIENQEWLESDEYGWFNGYYDNTGKRLDDIKLKQMTLTGQVFPMYSGIASKDKIRKIIKSSNQFLYDKKVGGVRLNTVLNNDPNAVGRMLGFAYGHKENGSMFSHMAIMYANALYKNGFVNEGFNVLNDIYKHCINIETSKIYPGIPEYVNPKGRGMYTYLTGSASWYILTLVSEVFGIKFSLGKLILEPKLLKSQFDDYGKAAIRTLIHNCIVDVTYSNQERLEYGEYQINNILINGKEVDFVKTDLGVKIDYSECINNIEVILNK